MKTSFRQMLVAGMLLGGGIAFVGCEGKVTKPNPKAGGSPAQGTETKTSTDTNTSEEPMLTVQSEPFGQTEAGDEVTQFSLRNRAGMKVGLIEFGGWVALLKRSQ